MESDIVINTDRDMVSLETVADTAIAIHIYITIDTEIIDRDRHIKMGISDVEPSSHPGTPASYRSVWTRGPVVSTSGKLLLLLGVRLRLQRVSSHFFW